MTKSGLFFLYFLVEGGGLEGGGVFRVERKRGSGIRRDGIRGKAYK